jgi:hypothetical protein
MRPPRIDLPLSLLALIGAALAAVLATTFAQLPAAVAPRAATVKAADAPAMAAAFANARDSRPLPSPAVVASALFGPTKTVAPREERPQSPPPPPVPVEAAEWLRAVGVYEDASGSRWTIVKDDRSGRAMKLRSDGAACEEGRLVAGADGLVVELGSKRYRIKRR